MPHAETPRGRIHYQRQGAGEPLLLIQGLSGHHRMWGQPLIDDLAQDFDLVAYNHRGIGESFFVSTPFTVADLAEDAAALLEALGWDDAHIFGISMGGAVTQELALRYPDRVRTLTLGCTWPDTHAGNVFGPGVARIVEGIATRDAELAVRAGFSANLSKEFAVEENYPLFRDTSLSVQVPAAVVAHQVQATVSHRATDRLAAIDKPTLVIHGTEDEVVLAHNGETLASLIPDAQLELWDNAGHLFFWEQPERTAKALRAHALGR